MFIPFGEWMPDSPALIGAARTAKNCIAEKNYYRSIKDFSVNSSNGLNSRCFGAISLADSMGNVSTFASDATKLYKLVSGAFGNVSKSGNYNTISSNGWEFIKFGNYCIATNYLDNMQYYDLDSSTLFADLAGTPPKAKHLAVINNFVVAGNTNDAVNDVAPNAIRWCAINNPELWAQSATTQADSQLLEDGDGGAVQKIIGNTNYGIIVQERCIQRMVYVGTPLIFTFEVVERKRGTSIPNSVVGLGKDVFYISKDGFQRFNGYESINIGQDKINKYFWDSFDSAYINRVSATLDLENRLVKWLYSSTDSSNGEPDRMIIYNWLSGRFTLIEINLEFIFESLSSGLSLENLDSINSSIDALSESLDSQVWQGGAILSGGFNTDHELGAFTGSAMEAVLETSEFAPDPNRRSQIKKITPLVDRGSCAARMATRNNRTDSLIYSSSYSQDSRGQIFPRTNAKYNQIELTMSSDFDNATGIQIDEKDVKIGAIR